MLKPILKDWLDANLPGIVEEIVTREVARITGKG
jgi:cell pole-organizing protein PopZ